MRFQIRRSINNIYTAISLDDGKTYTCRIKGKVLRNIEPEYSPIAVGDIAVGEAYSESEAIIWEREERKSAFTRWNAKRAVNQTIAANQSLAAIVVSPLSPPFRPRFLDRAIACVSGSDVLLIMNKSDQADDDIRQAFDEYSAIGFRTLYVSSVTGEGIEELRSVLSGNTTSFAGQSGVGKSTLINLLPRFYDVTSGKITIGGVDIRDVTQHELRERIGYVPQKGVLFSGTIESNLRYGNEEADDTTMHNALSVSQAEEFVSRMPEGLNSPIAQGGTNVSGGQKQRLSIARALTRENADIFIFDDTFSALDYATDAKLRSALSTMVEKTKATVFIVAQRVSTIRNADKIIVLDEGKMAGIGTHDELMKTCSVYQEIAHSQLSQEELAQ